MSGSVVRSTLAVDRSASSLKADRNHVAAKVSAVIVALCVPAIIVSSSVNSLIFDAEFYASRQTNYAVGKSTEYSLAQLRPVNTGLVVFFTNPDLTLPGALSQAGANPAVFNEREVGHMNDVRTIIRRLVDLEWSATAIIFAMIVASIYVERRRGLRHVFGGLAAGGVLTLLLIAIIGLLSLTDFERVFLAFHKMSFDNDLWLLDPRTDNLIRFFPFEFWFDATVTVAQRAIFAALVTIVVTMFGRRMLRPSLVRA